jgi:RimJ/RimL family protein N-acetyltransferase
MTGGPSLRTERLLLRRWRQSDRDAFVALNSDPAVMEYFLSTLTRVESDALADRIETEFVKRGYGLWAVEVPGLSQFIGYVGLAYHDFPARFTPAVEIGWRLDRPFWGQGFATEAAKAAVADGFERARLDEIVSFTATINLRSIRVMHKLGMTRDPADDFDNPRVPEGHRLRRHVLYRLRRMNPGN